MLTRKEKQEMRTIRTTMNHFEKILCVLSIAHIAVAKVPWASRPEPAHTPAGTPTADDIGEEEGQLLSQIEANGRQPSSLEVPAKMQVMLTNKCVV